MKYDFLEQIEVESAKADNVVFGPEVSEGEISTKKKEKKKVSFFNVLVVQLAVCIVIGLTFIALQLWTDVQVSKLGEMIVDAFNGSNSLIFR